MVTSTNNLSKTTHIIFRNQLTILLPQNIAILPWLTFHLFCRILQTNLKHNLNLILQITNLIFLQLIKLIQRQLQILTLQLLELVLLF
jgi:hypothetical protein